MSAVDKICPAWRGLYILCVTAGIAAAILYIAIGLSSGLQVFGDGSIFSYAVAARDAWAFHWHNIPGRLFTYVFAHRTRLAIEKLKRARA